MPLDKILNPFSIVVLNILIIASAELIGGGTFLFQTGFIHLIAIFFIALFILRIFYHHYTYDPIFEKSVHFTLAAALTFAASHTFEFASMRYMNHYSDALFANVVNFYTIGLILMIIGAESFIRVVKKHSIYIMILLSLMAVGMAVLIVLFAYNSSLVSMEPESIFPKIYSILILGVGAAGTYIVLSIRRLTKTAQSFANYLLGAIFLLVMSTFPYIFYEFLEETWHLPNHQIVYSSHFLFFASLSLLFLSFSKLSWGGVYKEVRERENKISG